MRPRSLKEVAEITLRGEDFGLAVRNFLDEFYRQENVDARFAMLAEEPPKIDAVRDAYLAAVAEHLAYHHGCPWPEWTDAQDRFLSIPWFADSGIKGLRPLLIKESPTAFRRRLLFVSGNALSRA